MDVKRDPKRPASFVVCKTPTVEFRMFTRGKRRPSCSLFFACIAQFSHDFLAQHLAAVVQHLDQPGPRGTGIRHGGGQFSAGEYPNDLPLGLPGLYPQLVLFPLGHTLKASVSHPAAVFARAGRDESAKKLADFLVPPSLQVSAWPTCLAAGMARRLLGSRVHALPARFLALVLLVEPLLERSKVVEDGRGVHLALAADGFQGVRPRLALAHAQHFVQALARGLVLVD